MDLVFGIKISAMEGEEGEEAGLWFYWIIQIYSLLLYQYILY